MNTEDLIKMPVGEDETSGTESAWVTVHGANMGLASQPPSLSRIDTETLINMSVDGDEDETSGQLTKQYKYYTVDLAEIEWPENELKHPWGKYGQPMCDKCKDLSLDFSTIWSDLHYILYERASQKECFNGIRDLGHEGMELADFMKLKEVIEADLSEAQVLALRFYTSHSFHAINKALRTSHKPHPLSAWLVATPCVGARPTDHCS